MTKKSPAILVVDDDLVSGELFKVTLEAHGFGNVEVCQDSRMAMDRVRSGPISIMLLDLIMPHVSGEEILYQMVQEFPYIPVIILTVDDTVDSAVSCMKTGAFDFMTKPVNRNRLIASVNAAMKVRDLQKRLSLYEGEPLPEPERPEIFSALVTESEKMKSIFSYVEAISQSPRSVLISGESGTGKELLAQAVHKASNRRGAFIAVNVSGLDDTMFTDTLFGHVKGAYTGAQDSRPGLVDRAENGTLFLDEIGEMEHSSQIKLLRLLQEGEYYPLGSDRAKESRVRIVAATNADLHEKQQNGSFRKDLYYRLISHHIVVPPLRERKSDIPGLVRYFIDRECRAIGRTSMEVDAETIRLLQQYDYPGNVRELQGMVADAVNRNRQDVLLPSHIETYFQRQRAVHSPEHRIIYSEPFPLLSEVERFFVEEALRRSGGNQSAAARLLGISQSTLSRRQKKE